MADPALCRRASGSADEASESESAELRLRAAELTRRIVRVAAAGKGMNAASAAAKRERAAATQRLRALQAAAVERATDSSLHRLRSDEASLRGKLAVHWAARVADADSESAGAEALLAEQQRQQCARLVATLRQQEAAEAEHPAPHERMPMRAIEKKLAHLRRAALADRAAAAEAAGAHRQLLLLHEEAAQSRRVRYASRQSQLLEVMRARHAQEMSSLRQRYATARGKLAAAGGGGEQRLRVRARMARKELSHTCELARTRHRFDRGGVAFRARGGMADHMLGSSARTSQKMAAAGVLEGSLARQLERAPPPPSPPSSSSSSSSLLLLRRRRPQSAPPRAMVSARAAACRRRGAAGSQRVPAGAPSLNAMTRRTAAVLQAALRAREATGAKGGGKKGAGAAAGAVSSSSSSSSSSSAAAPGQRRPASAGAGGRAGQTKKKKKNNNNNNNSSNNNKGDDALCCWWTGRRCDPERCVSIPLESARWDRGRREARCGLGVFETWEAAKRWNAKCSPTGARWQRDLLIDAAAGYFVDC